MVQIRRNAGSLGETSIPNISRPSVTSVNSFVAKQQPKGQQLHSEVVSEAELHLCPQRRPPCLILDLFHDFRDGSRLLDLLEVMSGQRLVSPPHVAPPLMVSRPPPAPT